MRTAGLLIIACFSLASAASAALAESRVVIDTEALTLTVYRGGQVIERFANISIGRAGAARDRRNKDHRTPLGQFRIARVKHDSDYHLFLGFDYPTVAHAKRALAMEWIEPEHYREIERAFQEGRLPPQDTPLGGYIGIHGIGDGDPAVHERFNWTEGCVALTNDQVDRLARLVTLGTAVEVR